jgi:hypothetical protein
MGLRVSVGVAALATTFAFVASASASAATDSTAARDAAATRSFIHGELAVENAVLAHGPAELAAGKPFVNGVESECGDLGLRVPRKPSADQALAFIRFALEVSAAYDDAALAPARQAIDRVARAQRQLRFSDPTLQWLVHGSTSAFAATLALRPPDVCADARRLDATNFTKITAAGTRFVSDVLTLAGGESSPAALMRRMSSYAPVAVRSGLQRLTALDHKTARLPVMRLQVRLLRELTGITGSREGSNVRVGAVLGSIGPAQL